MTAMWTLGYVPFAADLIMPAMCHAVLLSIMQTSFRCACIDVDYNNGNPAGRRHGKDTLFIKAVTHAHRGIFSATLPSTIHCYCRHSACWRSS